MTAGTMPAMDYDPNKPSGGCQQAGGRRVCQDFMAWLIQGGVGT